MHGQNSKVKQFKQLVRSVRSQSGKCCKRPECTLIEDLFSSLGAHMPHAYIKFKLTFTLDSEPVTSFPYQSLLGAC